MTDKKSPPDQVVMVPQSAIDWLFGEGADANGDHFEPPETGHRYWWRAHFRKLIANGDSQNPLSFIDRENGKTTTPPVDLVMVPQSAIDWLFGEGADANGDHFEPPETGHRYWWRAHFRKLIANGDSQNPLSFIDRENGKTTTPPVDHVNVALQKAADALRPLADAVYNDNGDMTVSVPLLTSEECIQGYFASKRITAALQRTQPADLLRGPTLAETDASNAEAGAAAISAILDGPPASGLREEIIEEAAKVAEGFCTQRKAILEVEYEVNSKFQGDATVDDFVPIIARSIAASLRALSQVQPPAPVSNVRDTEQRS